MRSVTGLPDNDTDSDTVSGHGGDSNPGPHTLSVPTTAEITKRHGDRSQAPLIHKLCDSLRDFREDVPKRRPCGCPAQIDLNEAQCAPCLERELSAAEATDALAAAFGRAMARTQ